MLILCISTIQAQLQTPSLSPSASLTQTVGLTEIDIQYSRPSVRGRSIFNTTGLLPFGEAWRTGANAASKISFSAPVNLGGQEVAKGSYTLISIPDEESWEIKWYTYESTNWTSYLEKDALFQLQIPVKRSSSFIETFDINIQAISLESATLSIAWEETLIEIPLKVHTQEKVIKNIARTMKGPSMNDYYQAALYLHESEADIEQALSYIQKVTASDKALFFQVTREALILKDLRRKEEAIRSAKRALLLSEKVNNKDFIRINKNLLDELAKN